MPVIDTGHIQDLQAGSGINVAVAGNKATLSIDTNFLRARINSSALQSINGVSGTADGSFFIHGSDCDSWGYITGGTAFGTGSETPEVVAGSTASGIWFTDLCPACQTCDDMFEIKQAIEEMNVWANMIKDVELHTTPELITNKGRLESLCIDGRAMHCGGPWSPFPSVDGRQLLQQYITVVHMWNYAVVQNNASFKLEIAPEDTAGFVVQTKRSLPNCDGTWHIRCTVTVEYDGAVADDGTIASKQALSVYVPKPNLTFKPFTLEETVPGVPSGTLTAENAAFDTVNIDGRVHVEHKSNYTTKIVSTDEIIARVGGTYELSFKILPFINYVIKDKDGKVISIRGGTVDISGSTEGGFVIYDAFVPASTDWHRIVNPTKEDYLNAKTAPTGSVPLNNRWRIQVLWEVGKTIDPGDTPEPEGTDLLFTPIRTETSDRENETPTVALSGITYGGGSEPVTPSYFEYKETRMYTCTGARMPNSEALISGSTVPVDIPEEEPNNTPTAETQE